MSMKDYSISWSDALIGRVETYLRDIHAALAQHYKEHGYESRAPAFQRSGNTGESSGECHDSNEDKTAGSATQSTVDVISSAGSFLQRTCVHSVPYASLHTPRMPIGTHAAHATPNELRHGGAGADLVLTIPGARCSVQDMREGRYLLRRRAFVSEVEEYLRAIVDRAARRMQQRRSAHHTDSSVNHGENADEEDGEEDDSSRGSDTGEKEKGFMSAAASRLARMRVHRLPIHGCYGNAVKDMLCISIARANRQADARHNNRSSSSSSSSHVTANAEAAQTGSLDCEVFVINIHFRPAMYCARAMNAEAARRHPCYTYCLLEDYHMPDYLTMLHTLCVQSNSLRQAIVLLKCWAHHVGLMAAASGHSEGLNGFIVAALVFYLYEEGVLTAHMSAESVVRMVWVQISRAILTPNKDVSSIGSTVTTTRERPTDLATATAASVGVGGCVARNSKMPVPVAEECGEVAVLRLRGEVLNILFRSSAQFVRHVVQPAADEALQFALSHEVFAQLVFTPLPLRYDAALVVHQEQANHDNSNQTSDTSDKLTECSTSRKSKPNEDGSKAIDARESREDADEESARMMLRGKGDIFSPSVQRAHDMQVILQRAFVHRIAFCSVWPISADRMQVIVSLSNESDGRSRLTRGPAIEQTAEVAAFNAFWGESVTSTRQLPDGAIYRCVLWNFPHDATQQQLLQQLALSTTATTVSPNITSNAHDNANAASASSALPLPPLCAPIVLRHITEYILRRHTDRHTHVRILLGELDGVLCERVGSEWVDVAPISQPTLHRALRHVEQLMTRIGAAALPCKVTGFDVIAASARHTEVFPIRPHLALTRQTDLSNGKVPPYLSTAATISPVHCVLTIDDSGCKIPDTPEAIRVMRGAICAQLAKAMEHAAEKLAREEAEAEADFRQPSDSHSVHNTKRGAITTSKTHPKCTGTEQSEPNRMSSIYTMCTQGWTDIIHAGYLFRVHVAHYREVALLRALQRDAEAELMEQKLFWSVQHHKMIRAVAIGHASYSAAVRIAKRWLSAMLLSEFVLCEAVELLVAYAYVRGNNTQTRSGSHAAHASSSAAMASMSSSSSNTSYQTPRTAACGFVHFLHLLATHDWTQPLRLSNEEVDLVDGKSDTTHHPVSAMSEHQAMFISAPYAPQQSPFTRRTPRALILHRLVQLAQSALMTLLQRRQLGVGDEPVILDDCVAQADTRHAVSHCCSLQHEQRCACRKGGAAEHAHGGAKEGLDVRTESALFRCSPRGFDLVMELHPQLILQPDRALPVSSWAAAEHNSRSRSNCVAGQIGHCGVECASSASSSWTSAAHAGSAGAVTFCGDVARAPTRVYQLDELDERGRRAYLSQLAEREPAAYAIRNARAALRDVGMIFYDALAPRLVYAVGVSGGESVSVRQMQKMYVELMHAGRGALLPTPVWVNAQQRAGTSPSSRVLSTAAAQAKATVPADELQSLPQRRKKHTGNQSTTAAAAAATKRVSPRVGMRRARSAKDDVALTKRLKTSRSMREEEAAVTAAPLVTKRVKSDAKVNATKVERVRCVAEKNTASIEARSAKRKNRSKSRESVVPVDHCATASTRMWTRRLLSSFHTRSLTLSRLGREAAWRRHAPEQFLQKATPSPSPQRRPLLLELKAAHEAVNPSRCNSHARATIALQHDSCSSSVSDDSKRENNVTVQSSSQSDWMSTTDVLVQSTSPVLHRGWTALDDGTSMVQPSHFASRLQAHHSRMTRFTTPATPVASSSLSTAAVASVAPSARTSRSSIGSEYSRCLPRAPIRNDDAKRADGTSTLKEVQDALRQSFDYAHTHNNVTLRKDGTLYQQETRAFRQARGRAPRRSEVAPHASVALAPVAALKALASLDRRKSPVHAHVQDALLLQQSVMHNQLAQSSETTWMRCLRCFLVFRAKPRILLQHVVQQSSMEWQNVTEQRQRTKVLARRPGLRKKLYSVGQQQMRRTAEPSCCPHCRSRHVQWAMEYVHNRTHAR